MIWDGDFNGWRNWWHQPLVSGRAATGTEKDGTRMQPSREPGKALRLVPTVALSSVPVKQSHYTTGNLTFALTPLKLSLTWGTLQTEHLPNTSSWT